MRTVAVLVVAFALSWSARASSDKVDVRQTLEDARRLAGSGIAGLPVELASVPPERASRGIAAWTAYRDDGTGERIVVYTASRVFQCASVRPHPEYQCVLTLASILIHEAWHFRSGPGEVGAYQAQIAFLSLHGGSAEQISGVRISARAAVVAERKAIESARRRNSHA